MIKVKTTGQMLPFKSGTALPSPSQAPCYKYGGIMSIATTVSGILIDWGDTLPSAPCNFNIEEESIKIDRICADAINRVRRKPKGFSQKLKAKWKSLCTVFEVAGLKRRTPGATVIFDYYH